MCDQLAITTGNCQDDDLLSCIICKMTLRDPVLLQCLHNACRLCLEREADKRACTAFTCPACDVVNDVSVKQSNVLISAVIQCKALRKSLDICGICQEVKNAEVSSSAWCVDCQHSLCNDCLLEHKKHNRNHSCVNIHENVAWSELYRLPMRQCPDHNKDLELVCLTCERPLCLPCAMTTCRTASHDIKLLSDPETTMGFEKIANEVNRLVATFEIASDTLLRHLMLPGLLDAECIVDLAALRTAKKRAVDAVSEAHRKAEHALKECYDTLQPKAHNLRYLAELMKQKVRAAVKYCRLALTSGDVDGMYRQLHSIELHLRTLLSEILQVREPIEVSKLVHMSISLPDDIDKITEAWIGLPKLCTDDPCSTVSGLIAYQNEVDYNKKKAQLLQELEEQLAKLQRQQEKLQCERRDVDRQKELLTEEREQLAKDQAELRKRQSEYEENARRLLEDAEQVSQQREQLQMERSDHVNLVERNRYEYELLLYDVQVEREMLQQQQLGQHKRELKVSASEGEKRPMSYGVASTTFSPPFQCVDIAVMTHGHLLLACLDHGLMEYDAEGNEVCVWKPPPSGFWAEKDKVVTVEALNDCRAVAGLLVSRDLVLIQHNTDGGTWFVVKHITRLQSPPHQISSNRNLVAVALHRTSERSLWSKRLLLFTCSSGELVSRQAREYDIHSVVLSNLSVVTSSDGKVKLSNGKELSVVESRSHLNDKIWRHESSEEFRGICAEPTGLVLYVAVRHSGKVIAISGEDGSQLGDVLDYSTYGLKESLRLSIGKDDAQIFAVLTTDERKQGCLISIYKPTL